MFVSYVLRLRPESVRDGRFVGEVEAVATGHRFAIRSLEQLAAFIRETVSEEVLAGANASSRQGREDEDW